MMIGGFSHLPQRLQELSASITHFTDKDIVFNLDFESAKHPYLLLSMPITGTVWAFYYFVCIILYCLMRLTRKESRLDTALDLLRISTSMSLFKIEKSSINRFVTMLGILLNIWANTAYFSSFYKYMQFNILPEKPNTLNDIIAANFSLVIKSYHYPFIREIQEVEFGQIRVHQIPDYFNSPSVLQFVWTHENFLGVSSQSEFNYDYFNHPYKESLNLNIIPIVIMQPQMAFYFQKKSILVKEFNIIILSLLSGGIINKMIETELENRPQQHRRDQERPITLEELEGIFVIFLTLKVLALVALICEIFWYKWKHSTAA